jgi:hypothetical protein
MTSRLEDFTDETIEGGALRAKPRVYRSVTTCTDSYQ